MCRFLFWFLYQRILDAGAVLWDLIGVVNHRRRMTYTPIRRYATAADFARWEEMAESMSDAALWYAARDCRKVESLWRGYDPVVEGFYSDQASTYGMVLARRRGR